MLSKDSELWLRGLKAFDNFQLCEAERRLVGLIAPDPLTGVVDGNTNDIGDQHINHVGDLVDRERELRDELLKENKHYPDECRPELARSEQT